MCRNLQAGRKPARHGQAEAGSGGEVTAEAADEANYSEEAAATPTTKYDVDAIVLHCILV